MKVTGLQNIRYMLCICLPTNGKSLVVLYTLSPFQFGVFFSYVTHKNVVLGHKVAWDSLVTP